jgi:hypothetical protein
MNFWKGWEPSMPHESAVFGRIVAIGKPRPRSPKTNGEKIAATTMASACGAAGAIAFTGSAP